MDRTAVKEARSWVKKDLKQRRAALSILKRVKDEKSAEKAGKSLMKLYAEPLLFNIPRDREEYDEAKRLLKFLDYFLAIDSDVIPKTSILREFIGGSCLNV